MKLQDYYEEWLKVRPVYETEEEAFEVVKNNGYDLKFIKKPDRRNLHRSSKAGCGCS